jgi:hypothetical protein
VTSVSIPHTWSDMMERDGGEDYVEDNVCGNEQREGALG